MLVHLVVLVTCNYIDMHKHSIFTYMEHAGEGAIISENGKQDKKGQKCSNIYC